jgi:hypothetical protein
MAKITEYVTEGSRIFFKSLKSKIKIKRYPGNDREICEHIVKDCWNGDYFQTSTNHFNQFWARDFGWCTNSLLELGYEDEVKKTIRYALNRYKKYNQITTTLTPKGKPYDFPNKAVDSLPWLIHSMRKSKFNYYDHKDFLNKEIKKFYYTFIDQKTGLVKENAYSSIKDYALRKSSCYDNCMVALLAKNLANMKLENPFKKYRYPQLIEKNFWNGEFFYDDLTKKNYVSGDANIFPFVLGIIEDKEKLKKVIKAIQNNKLDKPFPLKYTSPEDKNKIAWIWEEKLIPNYEGDTIWTHMGPLYIKLLKLVDDDQYYTLRNKYKTMIETYQNYLELFNSNGKPFKSLLYTTDHGMLWAANYLTL